MKPIEIESQATPEALAVVQAPIPEQAGSVTAAQAKIDAIASLTLSAYARASELKLTKEETDALQANFPDEAFQPGAAGKEHLIYIQHAYLRDRFIQVFGMGQWAIIPRNRWAEDFKTQKGNSASRVYVEAMLVIRGCFCAEAVGEMEYYPNNAGQNYGDAVEGAKTAALRRCAKELGVGLQAWKREFCDGWWKRKNGQAPPIQPESKKGVSTPPPANQSAPKGQPEAKRATQEQLDRLVSALEPMKDQAIGYFQSIRQLGVNQTIANLSLEHCPRTKPQYDDLLVNIKAFAEGPQPEPGEMGEQVEAWRSVKMHFGKQIGKSLGELDKKYCFGLWANYVAETEYNGRPLKPEQIATNQALRTALDQLGEHYQFTKG